MKAALLAGLMTIAFAGLAQAEGVTPASSSTAPATQAAGQPATQAAPAAQTAENHAKHSIKKRMAMNKKAMKDKKAEASQSKDEKAATTEAH